MSLSDRISPLCDLLLGAAFADQEFKDREREEVQGMLEDLSGGKLTSELQDQIANFDSKAFDLTKTAGNFVDDSEEDRKRLLFLVAAINDADDEVDFAEDDYLRALATALKLPSSALAGMTIDVEVEDLREEFQKVRKGPPPPPPGAKKSEPATKSPTARSDGPGEAGREDVRVSDKSASVDIDID